MSVTTEDVAEAVKQLWDANAILSDPTTGLVKSLTLGRVEQAGESPYTSFAVKDGAVTLTARSAYLQSFTVEFRTWTDGAEDVAANAGEIKDAIENVFVIRDRQELILPSGRTLALLRSVKVPGGLDEDEATRQAQAVKVSTDRFEFLCQG